MEFNEGSAALERGNDIRAIERLESAYKRSPQSSAVCYLLGVAYYRVGKLKESERNLIRAAKLSPNSAEVWQCLAAVYQKTNDRRRLVAALENLVRLALAAAYASDKSYAKARELYATLLTPAWKGKADPAEVHHLTGRVWQAEGKPAEARQEYRLAFEASPANAEPVKDWARTYLNANDADGALVVYNEALSSSPPCWAEIRLEIVAIEMGRKNYAAAVAQYTQIVEQKPEVLRARIGLAEALELSGDKRDALAQHREVLRLSPNQGLSQLAVAADEAAAGRLDAAEKLYLSGLANTLAEQQRLAESVVRQLQSGGGSIDFQQLLAIASESKKYDDAVSAGLAGVLSLAARRPGHASAIISSLDNLNRRFPRSRLVADKLIEHYKSRGAHQKVEAVYKRMLDASPKDAGLWTEYGEFLEGQGRGAEALKTYRKALEIDPKNQKAAERVKALAM